MLSDVIDFILLNVDEIKDYCVEHYNNYNVTEITFIMYNGDKKIFTY